MHGKQKRLTFCVLRENDGEEGKNHYKRSWKGTKVGKDGQQREKNEKGKKEEKNGKKGRKRE